LLKSTKSSAGERPRLSFWPNHCST